MENREVVGESRDLPVSCGIGMVAIPVLRRRVAPVLDWCSTLLIFPLGAGPEDQGEELCVPHLTPRERLELLGARGVTTLICGALSRELLATARRIPLTVICGVAGEVTEVLRSFRENQLHEPRFRLPGCRGPRRYRGGRAKGKRCGRPLVKRKDTFQV
jgi:hypothetical protein